jgi:hypothetical protein
MCSDDGGQNWHESSYFVGKNGKAAAGDGLAFCKTTLPASVPATSELPSEFVRPIHTQSAAHDMVFEIKINGRPASEFAHLVQMDDGKLYASTDLFQQWRLQVRR